MSTLAVQSHNLSVGIVGLPNSGKSTLFNALTKCGVPAENYPFCTIDKNTGVVPIPDRRLDKLSGFFNTEKKVPSVLKLVDIAGLVKGASKGEGLGNKFLSHIREVDVILFVLRAFGGDGITHVYNRVDPLEDLQIVQSELLLKDIETVQKRLSESERIARAGDDKAQKEVALLGRVLEWLGDGHSVIEMDLTEGEQEILRELFLLTNKRRAYILNRRLGIDYDDFALWKEAFLAGISPADRQFAIGVDVKMLDDISELKDEEIDEYKQLMDGDIATDDIIFSDGVVELISRRLDLITFYTGSSKECNAWSIQRGSTAVQCAGVIHTELAKRFITADIVDVEKMIDLGGMSRAKQFGIVRNVGKDYVVKDGEYMIVI